LLPCIAWVLKARNNDVPDNNPHLLPLLLVPQIWVPRVGTGAAAAAPPPPKVDLIPHRRRGEDIQVALQQEVEQRWREAGPVPSGEGLEMGDGAAPRLPRTVVYRHQGLQYGDMLIVLGSACSVAAGPVSTKTVCGDEPYSRHSPPQSATRL
jgi:hypothetical protein